MEDGATIGQSITALSSQRASVLVLGTDVRRADRRSLDELVARGTVRCLCVRTEPDAPSPPDADIITQEFPHRSAVPGITSRDVGPQPIEGLGRAVRSRLADTSEPVLVSIHSLAPLLAAGPTHVVAELLDTIRTLCPPEAGTVLAHLPVSRDHPAVAELTPACQAIVTLRRSGDTLEHRWEFPARESRSPWISLDDGW